MTDRNEILEEVALVLERYKYFPAVEKWTETTNKEVSEETCQQCVQLVRSLKT